MSGPYVEAGGWEFFSAANAREYLARRRAWLAAGCATPFLGDYQSRSVFETITLDGVKEE